MSENSFSMVALIPENRPENSRRLYIGFRATDIHDFVRWSLLGKRFETIEGEEVELDWLSLSLQMPDGLMLTNTNEQGQTANIARLDINLPGVFWSAPDSICFQFRTLLIRIQFSAWPEEIYSEIPFIQKRNIELGLIMPPMPPEIYTTFYEAADAALRVIESKEIARANRRALRNGEDLTTSEIAKLLGMTRQAVSKRSAALIKRRWITAREAGRHRFTPAEAKIIAAFPLGYKPKSEDG